MERLCVECSAPAHSVLVNYAVCLCEHCADKVRSVDGGLEFIEMEEVLGQETMEVLTKGGNERFREFWRGYREFSERYKGKRAEDYRLLLRVETVNESVPEAEIAKTHTFSERLTSAIDQSLSWFEGKLTPLLSQLDQRLSNMPAIQYTQQVIETGYQVYEDKVQEHIVSPGGLLHPLKQGLDRLDKVLDKPGDAREIELLQVREEARRVE